MSTQFSIGEDVIATRFNRGDRGVQVEMEVTPKEFEELSGPVSGDDGSEYPNPESFLQAMEQHAKIIWMDRFRMNRKAKDFSDAAISLSRKGSGFQDYAHRLASASQSLKQKSRTRF